MLYGQVPFHGETNYRVLIKIQNGLYKLQNKTHPLTNRYAKDIISGIFLSNIHDR